jgi:methyltransferase (TIGR00027 family)
VTSRLPLLPSALHLSERPSSTAQWTALGRALELGHPEPIVVDRFAPTFLSRSSRALYRGLTAADPVVRRAERLELAGLAASGLCRHRFLDDHLLAALPEVDQVLILGAGYDARAYRFASDIADRPVFEVDLPPISRRKAAIVAEHPDLFRGARVRRVEIDFQRESLAERLATAGFASGARTFVVWEGVSMYLDRRAVAGTLTTLGEVCGPGSTLALDLWQHTAGAGGRLRLVAERAMRLIGEPITFACGAGRAGELLGGAGFTLTDLAEADVLTARYATGGRCCDPGMYLVAAQR